MGDAPPSSLLTWLSQHILEALLAVIAWVLATFARRHISSMDTLSEGLQALNVKVAEMAGDIRSLREGQEKQDRRLDRLEDKEGG